MRVPDQTVYISGPMRSGKTTLLLAAARAVQQFTGHVLIVVPEGAVADALVRDMPEGTGVMAYEELQPSIPYPKTLALELPPEGAKMSEGARAWLEGVPADVYVWAVENEDAELADNHPQYMEVHGHLPGESNATD